jgi:ABC-type multidrug transport system permease subunit
MEKTTTNNNNMPEGMGWSVVLSIATFFASIAAIIVWLFFCAENFNVYQNIVIVVVIILGFVALMGATWAA